MDRERIKSSRASKSERRKTAGGIIPNRHNMRLAIPKRLATPGAQETIKHRRIQRRKAKLHRQILRLMVVILPLGTTLVFSEKMRQRKLREYIDDIEEKVGSEPINTQFNLTRGYNTVNRYPFTGISNVTTPMNKDLTAFFWQIPQTGGTTMKNILGMCLDLSQASRTSAQACDSESHNNGLKVCKTNMGKFVNCDPSDDHGIQRCNKLKVVESGLADVIVSSRFLHAASLFDPDHQARAFTIIREPVERMISTFHYLREATWEREYDEILKNMTLLEFANREETPTNWMVRYLTGNMMKSTVTREDLDLAKSILEKKFYILLTKEIGIGVDRFLKDMNFKMTQEARLCVDEEMSKISDSLSYPRTNMTSSAVRVLQKKNDLDTELYEHAVKLFTRQWTRSTTSIK